MGFLVISLDYELMWGVRDHYSIDDYGSNVLGSYASLDQTIKLFNDYGIKATIATVGLMALNDINDYYKFKPKSVPTYNKRNLSPYDFIDHLDTNRFNDKYYFCPINIRNLTKNSLVELASHTFSHYYCNEKGSNISTFILDVVSGNLALKEISGKNITSLVLPRNQINNDFIKSLGNTGIKVVRGKDFQWYNVFEDNNLKFLTRIFRLLDSYINISGHNSFTLLNVYKLNGIVILPGSRFLRPFKSGFLSWLQLQRIKRSMYFAAKNNKVYHLWWHPENHGKNIDANLEILKEICSYYNYLNEKFQFQSEFMNYFIQNNRETN